MSRQAWILGAARWAARPALFVALAAGAGSGAVRAQEPTAPPPTAGIAIVEPDAGAPLIPPEVQVVRFHGPEGLRVEVLGPPPEPIPAGDGTGLATVGLRVGVGYRLRVSNLPDRPGVELFPVVEVVGHLHRPANIDPLKFPIRIGLRREDLEDVADRGRLVTQVVYLEDPEQALPMTLPKAETPVATLGPGEEPLKVGAALGRVMAIVRMGGRRPSPEELSGAAEVGLTGTACPFVGPTGGRCSLPCGPVCGTPPPPGRPWIPRDEFLCDGGDHAETVHFGGDGGLRGIDPRDAVVEFHDTRRPRVLPTNVVCIYAPRFATVRTSLGPNETLTIETPHGAENLQHQVTDIARQEMLKMTQNQTAEAYRHRSRASGLANIATVREHIELRVLSGFDVETVIGGHVVVQSAQATFNRQKMAGIRSSTPPLIIKTAESAVMTGIIEGPNEAVMSWKPQEMAGVEVPPNRPGLAVIKRVSAAEAEPGDVVTFTIQYRNMGNVPIGSVSVIDSLLPRLWYVPGSAQGPAGTVFTAGANRADSTELRWDLPGFIEPGAEGYVSFRAVVR